MKVPDIKYDSRGLVPCIAQDAGSGEVLMLAWMNKDALARTLESGQIHFWSRSRQELWHKGETSGNVMDLVELRYDCDEDTLLALVNASGPACHTGERTCFYRSTTGKPEVAAQEALPFLERTIAKRKLDGVEEESYTATLFKGGVVAVGAKITEEAEELVRAGASETDQRVVEEAADLIYHSMVLLRQRDIDLELVYRELIARMK